MAIILQHNKHQIHLVYPHPRQANVIESLPHLGVASDVLLEEEHQLEIRLVLHVLKAAHLKCLKVLHENRVLCILEIIDLQKAGVF